MRRSRIAFLAGSCLLLAAMLPFARQQEPPSEPADLVSVTPVTVQPPWERFREPVGETISADEYNGFSLTWGYNWADKGWRDQLLSVSKDGMTAAYTYNEQGYRSTKTVNGKTTTFTYDTVREIPNTLLSEDRDGCVITYTFEKEVVNSSARCIPSGFCVNGAAYELLFENEIVTGIADAAGEPIVRYVYEEGTVCSIWEKDEAGNWVDVTENADSIGAINRIRYLGDYFDAETGWYYTDSYFDPANGNRFIDGISHETDAG